MHECPRLPSIQVIFPGPTFQLRCPGEVNLPWRPPRLVHVCTALLSLKCAVREPLPGCPITFFVLSKQGLLETSELNHCLAFPTEQIWKGQTVNQSWGKCSWLSTRDRFFYQDIKHAHPIYLNLRKKLAHYLQKDIFEGHHLTCYQEGTKSKTGSIGKKHHGLGEGKGDSKDVCFFQGVSAKKALGKLRLSFSTPQNALFHRTWGI